MLSCNNACQAPPGGSAPVPDLESLAEAFGALGERLAGATTAGACLEVIREWDARRREQLAQVVDDEGPFCGVFGRIIPPNTPQFP